MKSELSPRALLVLMCLCEVLTTLDVFTFASLLPYFGRQWSLSATELGWISGVFFAGYTLAVPVLVSLTDRLDARRIYMFGAAAVAIAAAGFALFGQGFWTAMLLRFLAGAGFAGVYMPGLRVLIDRHKGPAQSRAIAVYTAFFGFSVAASYLTAGTVQQLFGWRTVFWTTAGAAVLALVLVALLLHPLRPAASKATLHLLDFRPVLRRPEIMGYVLSYGVHAWELLGMRTWIVAFLSFVYAANGNSGLSPINAAALGALLAAVASIIGGELANRFGRRRVISVIMAASGAAAIGVGFSASVLPYGWLVVATLAYVVLVQGESAALTTGTIQAAPPGLQGATMAVHTMVGFIGGFFGPLLFGVVLDAAGGPEVTSAWGFAFTSLGAAVALGPVILMIAARAANVSHTSAHHPGQG